MIGSQHTVWLPPKEGYNWYRIGFIIIIAAALSLVASAWALAGTPSLKICFNQVNADTKTVEFLADGVSLFSDVLAGATISGGLTCNTLAIPATFPRGKDTAATLVGVNAFGEGGPASAPVVFRAPAKPAAITGTTVQVVAP